MKKFDLNIEKVLENWETHHAIREVIANALDEQVLTKTDNISIYQDENNRWHIQDFGRGLKYEHLTQNENTEKIENPRLIGKFGVGLKDALATFDRRNINILIKSRFGDITLGKSEKHDFEDITTLHAYLSPPSDPTLMGTDFILAGCTPTDIEKAKQLFLRFAGETLLETTEYGEVFAKRDNISNIYINGVKVAEEDNFLFSYNITSLTSTIRKALNRERTNVGRSAYSDRIKAITLACDTKVVENKLTDDLKEYHTGNIHDELKWTDVSVHTTKLLNAEEKVLFFTPVELQQAPDIIDKAKKEDFTIVVIPETVKDKVTGQKDFSNNPIQVVTQFKQDWNNSFEFRFVEPQKLNSTEREIFSAIPKITEMVGGLPPSVKHIKISETMRMESFAYIEAVGLWEPSTGSIIIKRTQLTSLEIFAGTLLHEIAHARSEAPDVSSQFEKSLTELLGKTGSRIANIQIKPGFLSKLF